MFYTGRTPTYYSTYLTRYRSPNFAAISLWLDRVSTLCAVHKIQFSNFVFVKIHKQKKTCLHPQGVGAVREAPPWVEAGAVRSWAVPTGGEGLADHEAGAAGGQRRSGSASPPRVSTSGGCGGVVCTSTAAAPTGIQPTS